MVFSVAISFSPAHGADAPTASFGIVEDPFRRISDTFQTLSGFGRGADLLFADNFEQFGDPFSCTLLNWSSSVGLTDLDAGTPPGNRRYSGPCGLRVQGGADRYLTTFLPSLEPSLVVRFYFFPQLFTAPALIYSADDDGINQIELWYNLLGVDTLSLRVFDTSKSPFDLTASNIAPDRWYSVEITWAAGSPADIRLEVVGDTAQVITEPVETTGLLIEAQNLGLINGLTVGGGIDFDAFESRRVLPIGRLLVGDVLGDGLYGAQDLVKLVNELDGDLALGQPDCNEDGVIDQSDFFCVLDIIANQPNPFGSP
ncbi:MAG: hypothetical protein LAT56_02810 [Wenzhouxiangella sp.]|nr:hypothetical protein [Wenzhouxiangella sp.]